MIPKIIHYCWFGRNQIPAEYQNYVDSWQKYMPDFKIINGMKIILILIALILQPKLMKRKNMLMSVTMPV